jgi:hypothetical protein
MDKLAALGVFQNESPPYSRSFGPRPKPKPIDATRSHDAVIRVYDDAGNVIETHGHRGDFKGPQARFVFTSSNSLVGRMTQPCSPASPPSLR